MYTFANERQRVHERLASETRAFSERFSDTVGSARLCKRSLVHTPKLVKLVSSTDSSVVAVRMIIQYAKKYLPAQKLVSKKIFLHLTFYSKNLSILRKK